MQQCLMLGAGHSRVERHYEAPFSAPQEETEWTTLDYYVDADIKLNLWEIAKWDTLDMVESSTGVTLPREHFHEIHAYEVLEHFGRQGVPEHFFNTFNNLWEMLRPHGTLIATCPPPQSTWSWGDPGHTREISPAAISFLEERFYDQCGKTAASDYRSLIKGKYWKIVHNICPDPNGFFAFALEKV